MASIAVVGATGNTGRATVKELKALGENPLCVVRSAEKAKEVLGANANIAVADVDDRAGMEKALKGIERVFIVTGHNPKSDA
jgi:NAD(P)H dehydrogenase (quinone)